MNSDKEKIRAMLIIEVIGKPPEHLTKTLEEMAKNINDEKGVKMIEKKIKDSVLMKDQKDFYINFAEIEVELEDIMYLAMLMFKYMPAHIELISPQSISLSNGEFGEILSEIVRRLHGYDEVARVIQTEKVILEKKLKEILEEKKK
jgi:hypothetical protein